jgi:hypothetical protein
MDNMVLQVPDNTVPNSSNYMEHILADSKNKVANDNRFYVVAVVADSPAFGAAQQRQMSNKRLLSKPTITFSYHTSTTIYPVQ